jgi:hypothetical protein
MWRALEHARSTSLEAVRQVTATMDRQSAQRYSTALGHEQQAAATRGRLTATTVWQRIPCSWRCARCVHQEDESCIPRAVTAEKGRLRRGFAAGWWVVRALRSRAV